MCVCACMCVCQRDSVSEENEEFHGQKDYVSWKVCVSESGGERKKKPDWRPVSLCGTENPRRGASALCRNIAIKIWFWAWHRVKRFDDRVTLLPPPRGRTSLFVAAPVPPRCYIIIQPTFCFACAHLYLALLCFFFLRKGKSWAENKLKSNLWAFKLRVHQIESNGLPTLRWHSFKYALSTPVATLKRRGTDGHRALRPPATPPAGSFSLVGRL